MSLRGRSRAGACAAVVGALALLGPVSAQAAAAIPPAAAGVRTPDQPVYSVSARMRDATGQQWTGSQSVTFRNPGTTPLTRIWLRLWANGPGGCATRGITVTKLTGGHALRPTKGCTALEVVLDKPVAKGRHGRVVFAFALHVPRRIDRYGSADGYSYLGNALPVLALHDSAGWHLDRYTPNGEAYYTTVADFTVRLDHPSDVSVPATGVSTDKAAGPGRTVTRSVAHHVRDFAWAVGPYHRVSGGDGNGVRVNVWWNPDIVTASQADHALRLAKRTMAHDAKAFGGYPYAESDVVLDGFTSFGGMEYPGFVLSVPNDEAVAHEITHNWWYGIVGNDEYRAPWLDESFTEYVTLRFLGRAIGGCNLSTYPSAYRLTRGMDFWDLDPFGYGDVVYGQGPCALADLEKRLGSGHMAHLLRTYALAHRFGFSTTRAFKVAAQREADSLTVPVSLKSLWTRWRIDG